MTATASPDTTGRGDGRRSARSVGPRGRRLILVGVLVVLIAAMLLDTKFVSKGSSLDKATEKFNAKTYGAKQFPVQQKFVASHAAAAGTLSAALSADQTAAGKKYGVVSGDGATTEVPVTLTGVVGKVPAAGYTPVKVAGVKGITVNVQLGPAIVGTDLRDVTGKIELGDFENQIEYQNAASAINNELKKTLTKAGAPNLTGKTITVTGVFPLINPKLWNVTPSAIEVK